MPAMVNVNACTNSEELTFEFPDFWSLMFVERFEGIRMPAALHLVPNGTHVLICVVQLLVCFVNPDVV
jgi:hypothetical protein